MRSIRDDMSGTGRLPESSSAATERGAMSFDEADDPVASAYRFLVLRHRINVDRVRRVDLLGELETTSAELDDLGRAIRWLIIGVGPGQATRVLEERCPLALAEFLVAAAVHDYRQGDYWSAVVRRTGLPKQVYPTRWGEAFERAVVRAGLATFDDLHEERAQRFVSRFLAHGGIPTACLDDFFLKLVVPALRASGGVLRAEDAIAAWRRSPPAFAGVDQPVRRFVLYGGPVARDFVERSIDLATAWLRGEPLPSAVDAGLPDRIITGLAEITEVDPTPARLPDRRLRRPTISYDPWAADALVALFPPQSLLASDTEASWRIVAGSWTFRQPVAVVGEGDAKRAAATEVPVPVPFTTLVAELEVGGEVVRGWSFVGMTPARPWLAFDAETGNLLESAESLPSGQVWLMTARAASIKTTLAGAEADPRVVEHFPLMSAGWAGFGCHSLDLGGCSSLSITLDGSVSRVALAPPTGLQLQPSLLGGQPAGFEVGGGDVPFQGPPPALLLPLPVRSGIRISPARWRLRIRAHAGSAPQIDRWFSGDDGDLGAVEGASGLRIDLGASSLLGDQPVGRFEVVARGPLGYDRRFEMLFVPAMTVLGLGDLLLPECNGAGSSTIQLVTSASVSIDPRAKDRVALEAQPGGRIRVTFDRTLDEVPLRIRPATSMAEVAISLPVGRLKWGIVGLEDRPFRPDVHRLAVSRDELEQASAPALVVTMPAPLDGHVIGLRVEDASGFSHHEYLPRRWKDAIRFPLREMLDAVRGRADGRLELILTLGAGDHPTRVSVGTITRALQVANLAVTAELAPPARRLKATWTEKVPVTDRVLRLWPLWRLWEPPITFPIPDEARGRIDGDKPSIYFPVGAYRVEIAVEDPWSVPDGPLLPHSGSGNCTDVEIGAAWEIEERLEEVADWGPLGILERFLALQDVASLARLRDAMGTQHVPAVIQAVLRLIEIDDADALVDERGLALAMDELRPMLADQDATFEALADSSLYGQVHERRDDELRRFLVELRVQSSPSLSAALVGLGSVRRHALWRLWPPMFLAMDGERLWRGDPETTAAAPGILGQSVYRWLPSLDPDDTVLNPPDGFAFGGTELSIPVAQLRSMQAVLATVPGGLLDDNAWTLANLAWLIRVLDDHRTAERAKEWIAVSLSRAEYDLDVLDRAGATEAVTRVRSRIPTADHGPLRMVPFIVGATALVERALARGLLGDPVQLRRNGLGDGNGPAAYAAARELYARDLCVMDLLLMRLMKG